MHIYVNVYVYAHHQDLQCRRLEILRFGHSNLSKFRLGQDRSFQSSMTAPLVKIKSVSHVINNVRIYLCKVFMHHARILIINIMEQTLNKRL